MRRKRGAGEKGEKERKREGGIRGGAAVRVAARAVVRA